MKFDVVGLPSPQGSKTRMPNGAMLDGKSPEAREKHASWRTAVADAARTAWNGQPPIDGPVCVALTFRLPMPKSRPAATRNRGIAWHTVKPDVDKLVRSTLDSLTAAGVITDDARIAYLNARAFEVVGWTGAQIEVNELPAWPWGVEL